MIVSFVNLKGGSGKTTLCVNVAGEIARVTKQRVLIFDLDPLHASKRWYEIRLRVRPPPKLEIIVSYLDVKKYLPTKNEIRSKSARYPFVLLDGAAGDTHISNAALNMSDLVVIPTMPDDLTFNGTEKTLEVIKTPPPNVTRPVPWIVVITSYDQRIGIAHDYERNKIRLAWQERVLTPVVRELAAFKEAMRRGLTVVELEPNGQAAQDIRPVTAAIVRRANASAR
ncbi:MAG: ParA family protein [Candidatus Lambdaproteobacteria bacterium]|nr:ParA family protein [Candidatus Lambdaproteobacteria bacterium]